MNNVKKSIGWADYTLNPITGCLRACSYCYARRIHERFNTTPFSDIVYHPDRLSQPFKVKKPCRIFVGSMSDIEYWPKKATLDILDMCHNLPQHTFMLLSKNPYSYCLYDWPKNTMQGLTITGVVPAIGDTELMKKCPRPFLSIEPLMGNIPDCDYSFFGTVICGAMTGPGALKPKPEWIRRVKQVVPEEKLYWKNNMRRHL